MYGGIAPDDYAASAETEEDYLQPPAPSSFQ
jgi:hypothetical protein